MRTILPLRSLVIAVVLGAFLGVELTPLSASAQNTNGQWVPSIGAPTPLPASPGSPMATTPQGLSPYETRPSVTTPRPVSPPVVSCNPGVMRPDSHVYGATRRVPMPAGGTVMVSAQPPTDQARPLEPLTTRPTRDPRQTRESGDARFARETPDPRSRESADPRERVGRDPRDSRDGRDSRDPRDPRDSRDGRDSRDPRDWRDSREASEAIELSRIEASFFQETMQPFMRQVDSGITEPLRQYGYPAFASDVSTFAPVDDIPVGPDYIVGPGDDLTISVWGPVDSTIVRTVDRNGRIVLPKIGDLRLWGLTFSEADRVIREQLSRYFRGFQTSVTMGRLRTVRIHVVGEVCQPGVYTLSSLATLTNGLFAAGGPTKLGSLRQVRLLRNSHTVGTLDLYDFLQRGDRSRDFRLESGDTVFVPTIGDVVAVAGEVKRPAIYEVRGEARLGDLIQMAGGVTPTSYLKRVQIVRAQPNAERVTIDVDVASYLVKRDPAGNPVVGAGDLVLVHRADPRIYNVVKVEGAVKYPGSYELKPLMRISQLLPQDKLLPEAFTERVEVARRGPDQAVEIVSINLKKAWSGENGQDLALKPLDEISVRTELREARTVTVTGQLMRPGRYVVADGERLSSIIERAGGFTERAFVRSAVFSRATLRRVEQDRLDEFVRTQEQRLLATASTTVVGAEKEEIQSQQLALQTQREALRQLAARVALGRMVVKLDTPAKLRGTQEDIVLVDGDTLDVPEPPASVLVVGAVRTSTSVLHQPGANLEYYLNRVGGLAKEADKKEIHIVKADGSAMSSFTDLRSIDPGDTIMVPPKQEEKVRTLPTVRDIMQTIGSALLSFAALAVLF